MEGIDVPNPPAQKRNNSHGTNEIADDFKVAVSKLTDVQIALVKQMGLWTYVSSLRSYRFDYGFTVWLLSRIDHRNQFLVDSKSAYIIGPDDVSKIFGLPNQGKSVINSVTDKLYSTKQLIRNRLAAKQVDERWDHLAARVVATTTIDPAADEARNTFIIAFAVYTLSVLVGHADSSDCETLNFVPALKVPSDFSQFNWADFLFHEIILESMKASCASRAGKPFKPSLYSEPPCLPMLVYLVPFSVFYISS
jgi:hypothetical protein